MDNLDLIEILKVEKSNFENKDEPLHGFAFPCNICKHSLVVIGEPCQDCDHQ